MIPSTGMGEQGGRVMLLLLSGVSLTLMGCLAGALLAWIPLSPTGQAPSLALWVLFPLFVLGGYVLAVMGARQAHWRGLTLGLGAVLLLLALSCAVGLLLQALGAWQPMAGSAALWYVLTLAGVPGGVGVAAGERELANE
jgi:hypothetical protein